MMSQLSLFPPGPDLPEGFAYAPDLLSPEEERELVGEVAGLPFRAFEFHGYLGKRRVVSFGWKYDFNDSRLREASPIPDFLLELRRDAGRFAGIPPDALGHVLVTEYAPGAGIGWHRDRPEFGDVVGVSLLSPCTFRFRRRAGKAWDRASFTAAPRSAYVLRGPSRTVWEHSIPQVEALRYSVTFRTLKAERP